MSKKYSRNPVSVDWATATALTTSTTSYQDLAEIEVWPFGFLRFDGSCTGSGGVVDIKILGSIDGGTTYDDTISSYVQPTTTATTSTTNNNNTTPYNFIKLQARQSTTTTSASTAVIKWFAK